MSGSRRSRFQGGLEERVPKGHHHPTHYHLHHQHQQQRLRNPWVAQESQSTSSSSSHTHRAGAVPSDTPSARALRPSLVHPALSGGRTQPHFLQPTFYGHPDVPVSVPTLPGPLAAPSAPDHPLDLLLPPHHLLSPAAVQPRTLLAAPAQCVVGAAGESSSAGSRVGAGSGYAGGREEGSGWDSPGGWSGGGCGGQCAALDDFCFHCLRVAFVMGVVGGVGLVIAGAVLHRRLLVLVYIGGLTAAVSLMLLGVHCCVRRDHVLRKRRLRERQRKPSGSGGVRSGSRRGSRGGGEEGGEDGVPLRDMAPPMHHQIHVQNPSHQGAPRVGVTAQPLAYHGLVLNPPPPPAAFRATMAAEAATEVCTEDLEVTFHTGKSLWRQKERKKPEIVETRH